MSPTYAPGPAGEGEGQRLTTALFLRDAQMVQQLTVIQVLPKPEVAHDRPLPTLLVAVVPSEQIDPALRELLYARSSAGSAQLWDEQLEGEIGWVVLTAATPDPELNAMLSFAKLTIVLEQPLPYRASFGFHLGQVRHAVGAVAQGGYFAICPQELLAHLEGSTFGQVLESLPYFALGPAPHLEGVIATLPPMS